MTQAGPFLVLDGIDGCGKSTQARLLCAALEKLGLATLHLREPGGTPEGEALRNLLLSKDSVLSAGVEALLFTAARRQLLERRVAPALAAGQAVVCERFHPSTFAYQAFAGGLPEAPLLELLHDWAGQPRPTLALILDLDPGLAAARRGADRDRIEARGLSFQMEVARGLRRYQELAPFPCRLIDASGTLAEVQDRIWHEVRSVLP